MPLNRAHQFTRQSPFSALGKHSDAVKRWPNELPELMAAVQNLLIYDVVAEPFYNVRLNPKRQADIHLRYVEDILDRALQIDPTPLYANRPAGARVAARCNNFGLVLLGALREHGISARARVGFATYFNAENYEDHWVVEYYSPKNGGWRYADPQFDAVWRERLCIRHDPADVPKDLFLTAAQVWRECRAGTIDPARTGISHVDLHGLFFVAGSMVRDLAALNRVELLPWDVWGAQPAPHSEVSDQQLAYFDDLADLLCEPDDQMDAVCDRYANDEQLKVGDSVYNALLHRSERLGQLSYQAATRRFAPKLGPQQPDEA